MKNDNPSEQEQIEMTEKVRRNEDLLKSPLPAKRGRPKRNVDNTIAAVVVCCKALALLTEEEQKTVIACLAHEYIEGQ